MKILHQFVVAKQMHEQYMNFFCVLLTTHKHTAYWSGVLNVLTFFSVYMYICICVLRIWFFCCCLGSESSTIAFWKRYIENIGTALNITSFFCVCFDMSSRSSFIFTYTWSPSHIYINTNRKMCWCIYYTLWKVLKVTKRQKKNTAPLLLLYLTNHVC